MSGSEAFGGGNYTTPTQRSLSSIAQTPDNDISSQEKLVALLQDHTSQLKFLATNQQSLQQGVNDATANPIQQIQQFVADLLVLLGGGQLAEGALDFGDLKYVLPALGALLGLGDAPFPIDLFQAASKLFFGYVVPQQQFTDLINHFIDVWARFLGINPQFVDDLKTLNDAWSNLFGGVKNLLPSVSSLFTELGITGNDLGPLGQKLAPILHAFDNIDLTPYHDITEFFTAAFDKFIVHLAAVINFIDSVLRVLGAAEDGIDVVNDPPSNLIVPFKNLVALLGNIKLGIADFNPLAAASKWLGGVLIPVAGITDVEPDLQVDSGFDDVTNLDDGSPAWDTGGDAAWLWDIIEGRTADGSARCTADGSPHVLLGTVIPVVADNKIAPSCWVKWSTLATTGAGAMQLQLLTDTAMIIDIDAVASPGTSSDWVQLSGIYTVGPDIATIRTRLLVDTTASGGQIWFDDAPISRTNVLKQGLIENLEENLATLFGHWADMLAAILPGDTIPNMFLYLADRATKAGNVNTALNLLLSDLGQSDTGALATYLQGVTSSVVDKFDGTAAAAKSIIMHADGTATASFDQFLDSGPVSTLIDNLDGTVAGIKSLLPNGDGTASLTLPPLPPLLDSVDGTVMSIADGLKNLANPSGTANYTLANWTTLLADTGLPGVSHLVTSLRGLLPAALDNLDGTALPTGVAQIAANLDGTATLVRQDVSNVVGTLTDNFDGTAMSLAHLVQNAAVGQTLTTAVNKGQQVIDAVANGLGHDGVGYLPSDIKTAVQEIPPANVQSVLGALNLGVDVGAVVNAAGQGLTGLTGVFNLAQLGNAAAQLLALGTNAQTTGVQNSSTLANQAVTKQGWAGPDLTADASFDIKQISGSSPTFINLTQTQSVIGNITTPHGGAKQSISFWGQTTTNLTSFIANLYKVDGSTGAATWLYSTGNIIGSISNTLTKNYINLPSANYINPASPGDWYAIELQVVGTGTYQVVGLPSHWMPAEPAAGIFPKQIGATRGAGLPVFDSAGTEVQNSGTSGLTLSSTINLASDSNCVVVLVHFWNNGTSYTVTPKLGVQTMTAAAGNQYFSGAGTNFNIGVYYILNHGLSGSQTFSVNWSANTEFAQMQAFSYKNVASIGTTATGSGNSTSLAQTVTTAPANTSVALNILAQAVASTLTRTDSKTARQANVTFNTGHAMQFDVSEAPGAASISFAATSGASGNWGAAAVPINGVVPAAPSTIAAPGFTGSSNIPWIAISGTLGPIQHAPVPTEFNTAGTYSYGTTPGLPSWFRLGIDYLDVIALGPGGGGGGGASGAGFAGSNTTVTITDATGTHILTAAAGAGGPTGFNGVSSNANASGPGNETWPTVGGTQYVGGGNVWVAPGSPPGGGGGGAKYGGFYGYGAAPGVWNAATYQPTSATISATVGAGGAGSGGPTPGWPGADGAVWFCARPNTAV